MKTLLLLLILILRPTFQPHLWPLQRWLDHLQFTQQIGHRISRNPSLFGHLDHFPPRSSKVWVRFTLLHGWLPLQWCLLVPYVPQRVLKSLGTGHRTDQVPQYF
jgi:hypothetical protein